jgi:CAAX protease family protein
VTRVRRGVAAELAAIGCVAAYNIVVTRIHRRARLPANVGAAVALAGFARLSGASSSELGLSRANVRRGTRIGLVAAAPLAAAASAAAVANPRTRRLVADERITRTSAGEAVFETLVRIPLETALAEEVIFRGVLLALGSRNRSRRWAIVTSSVVFGLWHVVPALGVPERGANDRPDARATASLAAVVATTAMAGAGFAWLRLRAGSVLAPSLAHAALNMVAFAGVRITSAMGSARPGAATSNAAGARSW